MKFDLDANGRFTLTAREGGWDLTVDDRVVHYCRTPVEAVKYMAETLIEESNAEGVVQVVEALASVEAAVQKVVKNINLAEASKVITPIIMSLASAPLDRREVLKRASLKLADCTEQELRVRHDRQEIVNTVKAILEPWFNAQGGWMSS